MKLLYIDDSTTCRLLIELGLSKFDIDMAVDGEDGINKIKQNYYDIILTDINEIFINNSSNYNLVMWYDFNGDRIQTEDFRSTTSRPTTFTVPNNAYSVRFQADDRTGLSARVSFTQFQNLVISYNTPAPAEPTAPTIDFGNFPYIASYTISTDLNPDPDFFRYNLNVTLTQPLAIVIRTKSGAADFSTDFSYPNIQTNHQFIIESRLSATGHDKLEIFIDNIHFGEVTQTGWQGDFSWNPAVGQDTQVEPTVTYTFKNEAGATIQEVIFLIFTIPTESNNAGQIPPVPPKEGHTIVGWSVDLNAQATQNQNVTPVYQALPSYEVTFLDWDNSLIGTVTVTQGQTATPPFIPTRTGYTFTSWLPPVANVQGNITTVAQYTPITYLVTWTNLGVEIKATQLEHDTVILSEAPFITRENHVLIGWRINPTETLVTSGQLVTMPLDLIAVWEEIPTYTVTWRDPSFNTLKIEYVQESGLATPPNYNPGSGFILTGWSPDPTQPITANTIFIAQVSTAPTQPTQPTLPGTVNATGLTDLFTGVFGAIVGSLMIIGTIDLFGLQLSSLFWLFFAGTGFMMIWRFLK